LGLVDGVGVRWRVERGTARNGGRRGGRRRHEAGGLLHCPSAEDSRATSCSAQKGQAVRPLVLTMARLSGEKGAAPGEVAGKGRRITTSKRTMKRSWKVIRERRRKSRIDNGIIFRGWLEGLSGRRGSREVNWEVRNRRADYLLSDERPTE
jgi:hypothetical protein